MIDNVVERTDTRGIKEREGVRAGIRMREREGERERQRVMEFRRGEQ